MEFNDSVDNDITDTGTIDPFNTGSLFNNSTQIFNDFFTFKKIHMPDYSILDALIEYSNKKNYNYEFIAQELSEIPGFVEIVRADCMKFKYSIVTKVDNIGDEWFESGDSDELFDEDDTELE